MLRPFLAAALVCWLAGRAVSARVEAQGAQRAPAAARLLQASQTSSEGCLAGAYLDAATKACRLCHHSCSRCSVVGVHQGPQDIDCEVCAGERIFFGVRRGRESGGGFARVCLCPRHFVENAAKACEPTHEELKLSLKLVVVVLACLCAGGWLARKACPKRFGQHRRAAAQAYLEAVARHRAAAAAETDQLKSSERQFGLKESTSESPDEQ